MKGGLVVLLLACFFLGAVVSQNCGCAPGLCCSQWGYCGTGPEYCTSPPATSPPATSPPASGSCNLGQVISRAQFTTMFPYIPQGSIYTYDAFIKAASYYPAFACTGDVNQRKREVAAFLGQTSQETSGWWPAHVVYDYGYYFTSEVGCTNDNCKYCDPSSTYPCNGAKGYYGRGPLQLSWNYNYGQVSQAVYGDKYKLLNDPDLILRSGEDAFRTSIWFWMTAQSPKPSCHAVMTGGWAPSGNDASVGRRVGYGMTTNIINGGLECSVPTPPKVTNRIGYFTRYAGILGVSTGDNLECNQMGHY